MAPSLKERYDQRQLQMMQERTRAADAQLLSEHQTAKLLVEVMDAEDLNKVGAIIQKLDTIKSPELPHLTAAIEQAQAELNKYTGGGPITKAWTKLKDLVGVDNPVVKITTFADALERGMGQIPQILKNNGINLAKADKSKSLSTLLQAAPPTGSQGGEGGMKSDVTGTAGNKEKNVMPGAGPVTGAKSDQEMAKSPVTGKAVPDKEKIEVPGTPAGTAPTPSRKPAPANTVGGQDNPPKPRPGIKPKPPVKKTSSADESHELAEADPPKGPSGQQKLKNVVDQIRKALAPGGIFGAFKKVPYIDGATLAQELVAAPIQVFANVAQRIQAGAKAAEVAPDMKAQIQGQGGEQTKHAGAAEPSQPAGQTQPGQPSKPTTAPVGTTGAGQQTPKGPGEARGGGAEVQGDQHGAGATPEKAQSFRAGLARIYKGAGVDEDNGKKLLKYLLGQNLLDRSAIENHGAQAPEAKGKTAAA